MPHVLVILRGHHQAGEQEAVNIGERYRKLWMHAREAIDVYEGDRATLGAELEGLNDCRQEVVHRKLWNEGRVEGRDLTHAPVGCLRGIQVQEARHGCGWEPAVVLNGRDHG